jgi:putative transposase
VYRAPSEAGAKAALEAFAKGSWGIKYPPIAPLWQRAWEHVIPFFALPPEVRRVIYTTDAIESLHMRLRKIIKARGHFPSDEAALKLLWLALRNITADWSRGERDWKSAMNQFAILYAGRFQARTA